MLVIKYALQICMHARDSLPRPMAHSTGLYRNVQHEDALQHFKHAWQENSHETPSTKGKNVEDAGAKSDSQA